MSLMVAKTLLSITEATFAAQRVVDSLGEPAFLEEAVRAVLDASASTGCDVLVPADVHSDPVVRAVVRGSEGRVSRVAADALSRVSDPPRAILIVAVVAVTGVNVNAAAAAARNAGVRTVNTVIVHDLSSSVRQYGYQDPEGQDPSSLIGLRIVYSTVVPDAD